MWRVYYSGIMRIATCLRTQIIHFKSVYAFVQVLATQSTRCRYRYGKLNDFNWQMCMRHHQFHVEQDWAIMIQHFPMQWGEEWCRRHQCAVALEHEHRQSLICVIISSATGIVHIFENFDPQSQHGARRRYSSHMLSCCQRNNHAYIYMDLCRSMVISSHHLFRARNTYTR